MRAFAVLALVAVPALAADPACDLSSAAGIDAAFTALTGQKLDRRCASRSATFPNLVAVGVFEPDSDSCAWQHTIHVTKGTCRLDDPKAAATELTAAGWAKANLNKRTGLATAWLTEVVQQDVFAPTSKLEGAQLVITFICNSRVPKRAVGDPATEHHRVTFDADGNLVAHSKK